MAIQPAKNPLNDPLPSSFAIDNFQSALECPVLMPNTLTDAVLLTPCGHSISEVACREMYKGKESINCPLCSTRVEAWYPNHALRSLVSQITGMNVLQLLRTISAEVKEEPIPFPGIGARFVLARGDWEVLDCPTDLVREMHFHSTTKGSLFEEMEIIGYKTGAVFIIIKFIGKEKTIAYLNSCGVQVPSEGSRGYSERSYRSNAYDTKALFEVIARHNEIPKQTFALIRDLVYVGDWRTVTPLKWYEKAILERDYSSNRIKPYTNLPPGKGAQFAVTSKDWEDVPDGIEVAKKLELTSTTEGSFLQKMAVLGLKSGTVHILVTFTGKDETIFYLNGCGLQVPTKNCFNSGVRYSDHCYQSIGVETELLLNTITQHNTIPAKELQFIRKLVIDQDSTWKELVWQEEQVP
ncbi:MAG: hypothetical protein JSR46_11865, partial [Verrucomicrobia bacterium]|nr:hypothetical protein [Verrucomicrobiota bacterium]